MGRYISLKRGGISYLISVSLIFHLCADVKIEDNDESEEDETGFGVSNLLYDIKDKISTDGRPINCKVALYDDVGADTDCVTATMNMLIWMGAEVVLINKNNIIDGDLDTFDIIVFPGGWGGDYRSYLGEHGVIAIRDYINNGMGFIGICAGAYFASAMNVWQGEYYDYPLLDLFSGNAVGPIEEIATWPNSAMAEVSYTGETFYNPEEGASILYFGGPYFEGGNFDTVATYGINGPAAMVAGRFGKGKVFLTGVHPEIEEGSLNDGVNVYWENQLTDPETDWHFMKRAVIWVIEEE